MIPVKVWKCLPQDKHERIMIILQVKTTEYSLFPNTLRVSPHESLSSRFTNFFFISNQNQLHTIHI